MRLFLLSIVLMHMLTSAAIYAQTNQQTRIDITQIRGPRIVNLLTLAEDGSLKPVILVGATLVKTGSTYTLTVPPSSSAPQPIYKRHVPVTKVQNQGNNTISMDIPNEANVSTVGVYINGVQAKIVRDYTIAAGTRTITVQTGGSSKYPDSFIDDVDWDVWLEYWTTN